MIFRPSRAAIASNGNSFARFTLVVVSVWIAHPELRAAAPHAAVSYEQQVKPLLETYCY